MPTNQESLKAEWEALAPSWIRESRHGKNPTRTGLLDKPMLDACGDVAGLRAIDCGCGEGRFCRILADRGAKYVLGVDLCPSMIHAARERQSDCDEYRVADAQNLGFLGDSTFDLAVSYLNQCDLADIEANTTEVHRILKPGGRFVIANLHPMRSAVGGWYKTDDGAKQHVILDRYLDEGPRHWTMMGVDFTNFHRTLSTYIRVFLNAGFDLIDLAEPTVSRAQLEQYPELLDELRVPNFIVYVLRRR